MNKLVTANLMEILEPYLTNKNKAEEVLDEYWKDTIAELWCIDDIMYQAKEDNIILNDEEAREIMEILEYNHDGEVGINWHSISNEIDWLNVNRKPMEGQLRIGKLEKIK